MNKVKTVIIKSEKLNLTQSYDKSPYTNRKLKKNLSDNTKTLPISSITKRMQTDLERSLEVAKATQLG